MLFLRSKNEAFDCGVTVFDEGLVTNQFHVIFIENIRKTTYQTY